MGFEFALREDERFPMCSTFKLLLVASVLQRVDAGRERLDRKVDYSASAILAYAPVAKRNLARGFMTVAQLCEAAIEYSDNTAANLLLEASGGPSAVTHFARSLGDTVTRLDRIEPELNSAIPGDPRDTTTPRAMVSDLRAILGVRVLSPASRGLLESWMYACKTGDDCLRAGIPKDWREGDKTGSGANGTRNDVAFFTTRSGAEIYVAAYLTGSTLSYDANAALLADVARNVVETADESVHK